MYFLWGRRGGGWEGHLWSLAMYFVQVLKDASLPSLCKDHVRFVIPFLGFSSCISFSCRDFVFLPGVLWIRWDCGPAWKTFRWDCGPALNTFIFIYLVCYTYLSSGSTNFVDHIYCPFRSECPCVPCLCPSLFPLIYFFVRESFCFFLLISIEFLWFFFCQVLSQWLVDQAPLGHKAPLPGEGGPRDRLEWCPACRGLLQAPIPMSSRHAYFYLFLIPSFNGFIQACFGGLYGSGSL